MFDADGVVKFREPVSGGKFRVLFAGDVCPGEIGDELIAAGKLCGVLAPLSATIAEADYRIIQWETPLLEKTSPIPKCGPNLNSAPACAEIAAAQKFDLALLANNHTGDHGPETVQTTVGVLHRHGLQTVGAGKDLAEAEKPLAVTLAGKKVLIFNWCEHEFGTATENCPGTAPLNSFRNIRAVLDARSQADFIIVTLHGGNETNPFPSPRMTEMCRAFAEAGADLVFNCHTHCPQGVECWKGVPIIYCPGNFYFPKHYSKNVLWQTGYLTTAAFDEQGVYALKLTPYHFDEEKVSPLTGEKQQNFYRYMEKLCRPLGDPAAMRKYYDGWCCRSGLNYLAGNVKRLQENWDQKLADPEIRKGLLGLRNIFTCESHNHMVMTLLRIIEEGRFAEAAAILPEIDKLQTPSELC